MESAREDLGWAKALRRFFPEKGSEAGGHTTLQALVSSYSE